MQWNPASSTTHWTALNWSCYWRRGGRVSGFNHTCIPKSVVY